jgi:TetR/AcrR family transcriptional regulator
MTVQNKAKSRTSTQIRRVPAEDSHTSASRSNRLLNAAIEEFCKRGYSGARVDFIARRARVNKQLLYYYYKSKSGLYVSVLERVYLRFRGNETAMRKATRGVDARTALHNLVGHLFRQSTEFLQFERLLRDVNLLGTNHLRKVTRVRDTYAVLIEVVEEILRRGVEEGNFRPGIDPKEFYISLAAVISARITHAATLSYVLDMDLLDKDHASQSHKYAVDLLLNGVMREKPRGQ